MANFDKSGDAVLGDCDVQSLTTTMDKNNITEAEFDVLWEANKRRFYVHQAWPALFGPDPLDSTASITNETEAKTKLWNYLEDFRTGHLKDFADCYFLKVHEGSDIRTLITFISCKFKDSTPITSTFDSSYLMEDNVDLKKIWEANGNTGDFRDDCLLTDISLSLPLADGTKPNAWYYSWYVQNTTFDVIHRCIGADGYKKVLNSFSGSVQKNWLKAVFEVMKQYGDEGTIPRGVHTGQTVEASPLFGYVDDNTTSAYTMGLQHSSPNYADLDASLKPCGWPITTVKIGGKYPPYD